MVVLQSSMAFPFLMFIWVLCAFVFSFVFVVVYNLVQTWIFPKNPKFIGCYWIILLPVLIIAAIWIYVNVYLEFL